MGNVHDFLGGAALAFKRHRGFTNHVLEAFVAILLVGAGHLVDHHNALVLDHVVKALVDRGAGSAGHHGLAKDRGNQPVQHRLTHTPILGVHEDRGRHLGPWVQVQPGQPVQEEPNGHDVPATNVQQVAQQDSNVLVSGCQVRFHHGVLEHMPAVVDFGIIFGFVFLGWLHDDAAHHTAVRVFPLPPDRPRVDALLVALVADEDDVAVVLGTVVPETLLAHLVTTADVVRGRGLAREENEVC
ncbi:hypothetical protein D3C77_402910 [compost metagenome]